jgi:diphosphomevalonate decarboxylase
MEDISTAIAHPNIAFIKYWGNQNNALRIPANSSLSMNLGGLHTTTSVLFDKDLPSDMLTLNGRPVSGTALTRVTDLLERIRRMARTEDKASITSNNNFPTGSGIASSASAFAALAMAGSAAAGLKLDERELSVLARTGSGSAARSIPEGFVEWQAGSGHRNSYAFSIAPPDYWPLVDLIAVISRDHKSIGSTSGHVLAEFSPLQEARVANAPKRLAACRRAIMDRDFELFAEIVELDSNMMHAIMQTSSPPLLYWLPPTLAVMHAVSSWRKAGLPACYTIDAGPNVHVLCLSDEAGKIVRLLEDIPGVQSVLKAPPGGAARLVANPQDV